MWGLGSAALKPAENRHCRRRRVSAVVASTVEKVASPIDGRRVKLGQRTSGLGDRPTDGIVTAGSK